MILLDAFRKGITGALGALLCFCLFALYQYDKRLFGELKLYFKTKGKELFSLPKFLIWLLINSIPLWLAATLILDFSTNSRTLSSEDCFAIGLGAPLLFWIIMGLLYWKHYKKETIVNVPFIETSPESQLNNELPDNKEDIDGTPENSDAGMIIDKMEETSDDPNFQINSEIPGRIRYCRYCGKRINHDSLFCSYCGKTLSEERKFNHVNLDLSFFKRISSKFERFKTKNRKPLSSSYPKYFIWIFLISGIISILSIICYFLNSKLMDWGKDDVSFILIWVFFGLFIVFTVLYFITHKPLTKKNNIFIFGINIFLIFLIAGTGIGSLICDGDILFDSSSERELMNLDKKLFSNNRETVNEGLTEIYEEIRNVYGFEGLQKCFEGRLDYWNRKKALYAHAFEIVKREAYSDNGLAQGIYGDYFYSFDDLHAPDKLKERAFYWWGKGAENQDIRSQYRVGNSYAGVISIPSIKKNLEKADSLWKEAASQGSGMAYAYLGDLYGTWRFFDVLKFDVKQGKTFGVDDYVEDQDGNIYYSEIFDLPKDFHRDIKLAKKYWTKAMEIGDEATRRYASDRLERIYPEEQILQSEPVFEEFTDSVAN